MNTLPKINALPLEYAQHNSQRRMGILFLTPNVDFPRRNTYYISFAAKPNSRVPITQFSFVKSSMSSYVVADLNT